MIKEIGKIAQPDGGGGKPPAPPTEEEQKIMMDYLQHLDKLKDEDPAAFAAAMAELGIGSGPVDGSGGVKNENISSMDNLSGLAEQIAKMRNAGEGGDAAAALALNMPGQKDKETPGMDITPSPGFVIKTRRIQDSMKAFINLCVHEELAKPGLKKRLNENGEEVEGMNVPMSVGPLRMGKDKEAKECLIFDIIVNPEVIKEATEANDGGKQKDFLCQMAIQCIEGKNNNKFELDNRYKLPKLKYMGEVVSQRIQDRKKMPNIEEVLPNSSSKIKKQKHVSKSVEELKSLHHLDFKMIWNDGTHLNEKYFDGQYIEPLGDNDFDENIYKSIDITIMVLLQNLHNNILKN